MKILSALICVICFASACDRVPYKDAYENPTPIFPTDTLQNDSSETDSAGNSTYLNVTNFDQNVLLEDYTGHTCGNCPYAATETQKIEAFYGKRVVVMAIHCGQFAKPNLNPNETSFKADFRTSIGDELDNKYGPSNAGLPKGIANRKKFSSTKISLLNHTEWGNRVNTLISQQGNGVGLRINPKFNSTTRKIRLYAKAAFKMAYSGKLKMATYIIEDSIVSWQKLYPTPSTSIEIENYVHNHVLRSGLSPGSGSFELTSSSEIIENQSYKSEWFGVLPVNVKVNQAKVILILYRSDNDEIVQVTEEKLVK